MIGVDRAGDLAPLKAAASGAKSVQGWLEADGYHVTCLTDKDGPVTASAIKTAVRSYIEFGTVRQLVMYFAGHGYLKDNAEIWLLSGSPSDPDEAVDQTLSGELARSCGVPHVTFISDACRSVPRSLTGSRVRGSSVFPNLQDGPVDVQIDRFFATKPGDAALELTFEQASGSYVGLFTEMLQAAHSDPSCELVRTVNINGSPTDVVPNRALQATLPGRVAEAAQLRSVRLSQRPQLRLESGEDAFVARATFPTGLRLGLPQVTLTDKLGGHERLYVPWASIDGLEQRFGGVELESTMAGLPPLERDDGRTDDPTAASWDVQRLVVGELEADTSKAVTVLGADLSRIVEIGIDGRVVPLASGQDLRIGSHFVEFDGGHGTLLAAIPGFSACVFVNDGHIVHVGWRKAAATSPEAEAAIRLRAEAAASARAGTLALDRDGARALAAMATAMSPDPTLSLYAALALADLGVAGEIGWLARLLQASSGQRIFDLHALAQEPTAEHGPPIMPTCPMLSRTWSFLRARGMVLPDPIEEAGRHRLPGLWSTFDAAGMRILADALGVQ